MKTIKDWKDAKHPFFYRVEYDDCCKAVGKSAYFCVQANAIKRVKRILAVKIFRNIAYVWFEGDDLPTRYELGALARELAQINDLEHTKAALQRALKRLGNDYVLNPPRHSVSKEYLRSPEFKQLRRDSYLNSKTQTKPKRAYRKPKAIGLRHGGGLSHVWEDMPAN